MCNRFVGILLLICLSISIEGFAQTSLMLGGRLGANYTSFSSAEAFKPFYSGSFRPTASFDAVYSFNNKLSIQSGAGYYHTSQKRINFQNEFLGLSVPVLLSWDFSKKETEAKLFPFVSLGGEGIYILKAIHIEDNRKESIMRFVNPLQGNLVLEGGIKRLLANNQILLLGLTSKTGVSRFPTGGFHPLYPRLRPFQIGLNAGWRWQMSTNNKKK